MKQLLITAILLCSLTTQAQQLNPATDALEWNYTSLYNLRNQETVTITGSFRVNDNNTIDWIQKDGEEMFTFTVTNRKGSWTDITVNGSLTYVVTYDASQGTIKISRSASGLLIEMDIDNPTRPNTQYNFIVTTVQPATN